MNIVEILKLQAIETPVANAIIDTHRGRERFTSFAGLEESSAKLAALLRSKGIKAGDAVLVFYPMSAELYATLLAIFRLGAVAMFLDPSAGREHIERCCALHLPQAFIASPKAHLLRLVSPALRRIKHKFVIGGYVPGALSLKKTETLKSESQIAKASDETPALITFTSGSTGQPKAALRTHGFLLAQHYALQQSLSLMPGEVNLATLPVFVLANLASGVTSIIPNADLRFPGAIESEPLVAQIQKYKSHSTAASPALLERIADYCQQHKITLDCFQKIFTGGAPVFPRLLDKLHSVAPQADVTAVYGSTEAEPIAEIAQCEIASSDRAAMHSGKGLLAGMPVPQIQLRIIRDQWGTRIHPLLQTEFDDVSLPEFEAGEIVVSGDHVLPGYLHGSGDEETKFRVGNQVWHRTGDAGYLDAQGRLWLLGRCSAKVISAEKTIYPFAVECAATRHTEIKRSALIQHQSKRMLIVEPFDRGAAMNWQELKRELSWAAIDEIRCVDRIPVDKRHNAKVDYPALHKLLGDAL
ncbi:MAG TPA: AMP-binding protein [Blastocatellia bacterium]|nr:AMP-binding protein [Blastocatellia bacterium]